MTRKPLESYGTLLEHDTIVMLRELAAERRVSAAVILRELVNVETLRAWRERKDVDSSVAPRTGNSQ